jgi:hypothetical protein
MFTTSISLKGTVISAGLRRHREWLVTQIWSHELNRAMSHCAGLYLASKVGSLAASDDGAAKKAYRPPNPFFEET